MLGGRCLLDQFGICFTDTGRLVHQNQIFAVSLQTASTMHCSTSAWMIFGTSNVGLARIAFRKQYLLIEV